MLQLIMLKSLMQEPPLNNLAEVDLRMTLTVLKDEHGEFFMMYSIRRDSIPNGVSDQ